MSKALFVSGIGTEVGKTVVSSILVETLKADYWKPIQSGDLHYTDSDKIKEWSTNHATIHTEGYRLETPASPHYSARLDGVEIQIKDFKLPITDNTLIVEGAGGLLVPINDTETVLDVMKSLKLPVVLVSSAYLGSINHTLLTLEKAKAEGLTITALIFSGKPNKESESIIAKQFPEIKDKILCIEELKEVSAEEISRAAERIKEPLKRLMNELD